MPVRKIIDTKGHQVEGISGEPSFAAGVESECDESPERSGDRAVLVLKCRPPDQTQIGRALSLWKRDIV